MRLWVLRAVTHTALSLTLLLSLSVQAGYLEHKLEQGTLTIQLDEGSVSLTPLSASVIQTNYVLNGRQSLPSYSIKSDLTPVEASLSQNENAIVFNAGDIRAVVTKSPFKLSYYQGEKLLLAEESGVFAYDGLRGFRFQLQDDEKLLGTGERVLGMDRRGHRLPLYNRAHYGYETESRQMYFSLPMVMSSNHYLLLFDNTANGFVDLGASEKDVLQFEATSGRLAYVVVAGDTYPDLIQHYVEVTGKQPMPPRWSLGNYASRFGYHSQQEVEQVVELFAQKNIPLDALVLDLYWFGKDIKGHMGNLEWDRTAFPEPEKMIQKLKDKGVETILITEPFVLTTSSQWQSASHAQALAKDPSGKPKTFDFYFGNTGLIDVFNPKGRQWFENVYDRLHKQGVSGWWGDLGEPEVHPADAIHTLDDGREVSGDTIHNAYGHQWAKMVYEQQRKLSPDTRPFIMMRAGFAGSQRYGMVPWTGDVNRSWGGLKPQVELALQMGLMGLGYIHSDLGGFAGGEQFDPELYIRWLQYGVFQPVYRPHAQENIAPEPVFHDDKTRDIVGRFIRLRYAMLPYNYTLAYENHTLGLPLMRPLMFEDEHNPALIDHTQSYLWGHSFLVTPVTDPGVTEVKTLLPDGIWFDFWNDTSYEGGKTITQRTQLDTLPVLVRAGAFVPLAKPMSSTKEYDDGQLVLHYYAHASVKQSSGQLYQDDGNTPQAVEKGAFQLLTFKASQQQDHLTIKVTTTGNGYEGAPMERNTEVVIHNWHKAPQQLRINGRVVNKKNWSWSKHNRQLHLSVRLTKQPMIISIQ